jgi:centrosomal protein CEP290
VSRLEASLKKHKEQDEETRKDVLSHQETIASLQTDLDKKSEMLQEVKHHLQLAAKREEELSRHHATQEEVQLLSREREQLRQENRKLREELASFDQSFFDEIEEIKFNYHESLNKIKHYQEQLKVLSAQHNFPSPNL